MQKSYKSIRIFNNPLLEKFTHVHPITPLVIFGPLVVWLYWQSFSALGLGAITIGTLSATGLFVWTLMEYILHRFIFHFDAETPMQKRLVFLFHGLHHDDPIDPTRLVMPPIVSIGLAYLFFYLFRLFMGPVWVVPYFAGFIIGYLCYDYIHFSVHHFTPRTRLGKFLKQNHMLHHYVSSESRWGVSSPLWDHVFGTLEQKREYGS